MEIRLKITVSPHARAERYAGKIVEEVHGDAVTFGPEADRGSYNRITPGDVAQEILDLFTVWQPAGEYWTVTAAEVEE